MRRENVTTSAPTAARRDALPSCGARMRTRRRTGDDTRHR
ncbi:hypothetical protein A33M_3228 [Rhodovulum sp. PH10]|nr:hypothetical protein A33M_3228 [Rhodovulum sp. PH10]